MKIVHTEASWGWGGQEIRILTESAEFMKHGDDVRLVADSHSTIAMRASEYGVPVIQTTLRAKRLPDLLAMRVTLKKLKPDVVVCHSSTDHWLTALARLFLRDKFAIVRARHISARINSNVATRWLYKRGCEGCLTTSTSIQSAMIRQGLGDVSDIRCIPTGIEPPPQLPEYRETRHHLDIDVDRFVIVIVATLRSWKGHADLIRSMALLTQVNPLLLVLGDGPQASSLKMLAQSLALEENIRFMGHQRDVYRVMNAADVFTLPSYANEGVPQAVLQAMAVGLPIVSCPVGGIPEALEGYSNKILVPPRSPTELARAFIKIHDGCLASKKLGVQDRMPMIKFTPERTYRDCLDLYRDSVSRFKALHAQRDHCES